MKPLEGRVALVTGVSRRIGIGFAIASRLASMGADLFIHSFAPYDREQPWGAVRQVHDAGDPGSTGVILSDLRKHGTRVEHLEADFIDPQAPVQTINAAAEAFGHVDILIANHAYSTWQPFLEMSAEDIDRHMAVNVRGSLLLAREFAKQHDDRPGGRVVLMTSGQHLGPMGREVPYAASKGALHQITVTLSDLLIERGITVNTVNPGPTDTGYAGEEEGRQITQRMPQGRWGEPDDAARLIAWLVT
ncbi:MAG: SDR family oxidoreductase, partial [Ardenticatenaceae bacterium]